MKKSVIKKISILSHNISTPLTVILGYADMIKIRARNKEVNDFAKIIKEETMKVSKYCKEINKLSTPEQER